MGAAAKGWANIADQSLAEWDRDDLDRSWHSISAGHAVGPVGGIKVSHRTNTRSTGGLHNAFDLLKRSSSSVSLLNYKSEPGRDGLILNGSLVRRLVAKSSDFRCRPAQTKFTY
jgi:hypothetical protein